VYKTIHGFTFIIQSFMLDNTRSTIWWKEIVCRKLWFIDEVKAEICAILGNFDALHLHNFKQNRIKTVTFLMSVIHFWFLEPTLEMMRFSKKSYSISIVHFTMNIAVHKAYVTSQKQTLTIFIFHVFLDNL